MDILCTERFKDEYVKLIKKKSYKPLWNDFYEYFFNTSPPTIYTGDLLNGSNETPYVKKRFKSGGLRVYFFAIKKNDELILLYAHPKVELENISDENKSLYLKEGIVAIKTKNYFILKHVNKKLTFSRFVPVEIES